jgi:arylsulfatase A-like enzyme
MYEESFQMPFLVRHPQVIKAGSICNDIISNVDFAATWLDLAGLRVPSYVQGTSFLPSLKGIASSSINTTVAYHRYWMHRDDFHNAYAHYGCRNHRYKIIFWYNEGLGQPGTKAGGEEQEWELFDCQEDPLELFNVWYDDKYAQAREEMVRALEDKMADIGDVPAHPVGLPAADLVTLYANTNIDGIKEAKANQKNL